MLIISREKTPKMYSGPVFGEFFVRGFSIWGKGMRRIGSGLRILGPELRMLRAIVEQS